MVRTLLILTAAMAFATAAPLAAESTQLGRNPPPGTSQPPSIPPVAPDREPGRTATRIPEPDTIALFLLGAAGLVVGRRLSRTGRRRAPDA